VSDRKYFDIAEWQATGYLQESNRQFFHPHGLALEVTRITAEDGEHHTLKLNAQQWQAFEDAIGLIGDRTSSDEWEDARTLLLAARDSAKRYGVGDAYLSGIWDSRSDPEGIIFGDWSDEDRQRAQNVADERSRHAVARARMFNTADKGQYTEWIVRHDLDIEPTDWTYEDGP
jgi:hypothetical protein